MGTREKNLGVITAKDQATQWKIVGNCMVSHLIRRKRVEVEHFMPQTMFKTINLLQASFHSQRTNRHLGQTSPVLKFSYPNPFFLFPSPIR